MTAGPLYLAIDQGSHASRAMVFDGAGGALAHAERPLALDRPRPDWAEHDAEALVASIEGAISDALSALGPRAGEVAAAGLATQRSNVCCWDAATGTALAPVISWQDRRAHAWLRRFEPQAAAIHRRTGLTLTPHYGASKLAWCLDHLPAVRRAAEQGRLCWGPMASFLVQRLTLEGVPLADPQNASRTQLWDLHRRAWSPELLALFGLPAGHLPRSVPTVHPFGTLRAGGGRIALRVVNGDQSSALFAYGAPAPGAAYVNVGTGAFIQRLVTRLVAEAPRLLTGIALWADDDLVYSLEGTVNGAGSALEWLAAGTGRADLLARLPAWLEGEIEPPLFLNGVSGVGSPFWCADLPSRFEGPDDPAGDAVAARAVAVVESIVFLLQANAEEMARHLPRPERVRISGGLARLDGLCRRLASLMGVPLLRQDDTEATARGTAFLLAGRPAHWRAGGETATFPPGPDAALAARYARWRARMAEETGY
ncbi:MAG: hypothetical protein HY423_11430 [Candidatus Lambdaproteobacteria bacterium]|nr:hypothetical protein [Candidatus Lambdaproteobacteria bacterium]